MAYRQRQNCTVLILLFSLVRLFSLQVLSVTGPSESSGEDLLNLVFEFINDEQESLTVEAQPVIPQGWRLQFPLYPLTLEPGQSDIIFLSLFIPSDAAAGSYQVGLTVPASGTIVSEEVTVLPVYGIDLSVLTSPPIILNTREYSVDVSVKNTGNVRTSVFLEGKATYLKKGSFTSDEILLDVGESREVRYEVTLEEGNYRQTQVHTTIQAGTDTREPVVKEVRAVHTWIPPVQAGSLYRYVKLSPSASLSSSDIGSASPTLVTGLSGSGALDDENHHNLSFSLPMPSLSFDPLKVTWSTFNVSYRNPVFSVEPNTSFSPTSLVPGLSDQGFLFAVYANGSRIELFSTTGAQEERGIGVKSSLTYREADTLSLSWTYDRAVQEMFLGVSGFMRPYDISNISYSGAVSILDPDRRAFNLQLSALENVYKYSFYVSHKSAKYLSAATGENLVTVEGSLFPSDAVSFTGSYTFIDRDRVTSTYQSKHTYKFSAGYLFSSKSSLAGSFSQVVQYVPTLSDQRFTVYSGSFSTISGGVELKAGISHMEGESSPSSQLLSMSAAKSFVGSGRVTGSLFIDTGSSTAGLADSLLSAKASFSTASPYDISGGLDVAYTYAFSTGLSGLTAGGRVSYSRKGFGGMSAGLSYTRLAVASHEDMFSFSLSYSTSINVPIGKRNDVAQLSGRIVPLLPTDSVSDVIVTVGDLTAITDSDGHFTFPAVPIGTYQVSLAPGAPGHQFLIVDPEATLIELADQNEEVFITITRPVMIRGSSDLSAYGKEGGTGIIVSVESVYGEQRKMVNRDGSFSFAGLLPATYSISVLESTVPEGYVVEFSDYELDLRDGQDISVTLVLKPIMKEILFQGGGEFIELL